MFNFAIDYETIAHLFWEKFNFDFPDVFACHEVEF